MSDCILRIFTTIIETFLEWTGCGIGRVILKLAGAQKPTDKASCTVGMLLLVAVLIVAVYYLAAIKGRTSEGIIEVA
jgi:hypothetical protein